MKKTNLLIAVLTASAFLFSCKKDENNNDNNGNNNPPKPEATVVQASGDLTTALTDFRHLLGDSLNTVPGKTSGRREVNWDGVPPNFNNNESFPANFFNDTDPAVSNGRKRGLYYVSNGTTFRVDSSNFVEIDASYAGQFKPFSGKRTFSGGNSNVTESSFQVPGQTTPAFVKGFGAVFSDVDDAASTTMEFYNGNRSLGVFKVPVAGGNSFSFLGVFFPNEKITRVKITAGNARLAPGVKDVSDGGSKDLVVMDDFFYNEPIAQ